MQPQHAAVRRGASRIAITIAIAIAVALVPTTAFGGTVFLDPGHGGRYPGAVYGGVEEQRVNLLIALEARKVLEARGHIVAMSRTGDYTITNADIGTWNYAESTDTYRYFADGKTGAYPIPYDDLQARCDKANRSGADIFISIHNNAGGTATGTESFYNTWNTPTDAVLSRSLAGLLQSEVTAHASTSNRGVNDVGYYVIRWSNMPSALVEVAFLSNATDRAKLLTASFRHNVAVGIADAVDRFYASKPFTPIEPRLQGADRYGTSAAAALSGWPSGADAVILASGEDWADALAASPLSTRLDAPVLLTAKSSLPASTASAIRTLGAKHIVVLGSASAVETGVAEAACAAAGLPTDAIERLGGADRYETAVLIAERMGVTPGAGVSLVAGTAFPDAASASAFSGMRGMPILLTRKDQLSGVTASYLARHSAEITSAVVVGGPAVVSQAVVNTLKTGHAVTWLWGADRYSTNLATLGQFWPKGTMTPYVATSENFPDALTAGAVAGHAGQPLVMCGRTYLPATTRQWVMDNTARIPNFTMVGSTGVLSNLLEYELAKARRVPAP
ncbi:MAG: cell wall-binding repeat-containing protein [Actinomycetia bacterium]|nr:cell wall-binding repeat-containing protein [Actinomycetes bacterium]